MKRSLMLIPFSFVAMPALLMGCDGGACPPDERGSAPSAEARAFIDAALKAPKDYLNLEKSKFPFVELFKGVAALLTPDDQAPALRIIVQMLEQGRKAFSKQLVREAVRQAELVFTKHPELPVDQAARMVLKEKLDACSSFFVDASVVASEPTVAVVA